LPAARRFKELGVSSEKEIPMLDPVELVSRKALPYDSE
jgi:DNA recombination protein RmuC